MLHGYQWNSSDCSSSSIAKRAVFFSLFHYFKKEILPIGPPLKRQPSNQVLLNVLDIVFNLPCFQEGLWMAAHLGSQGRTDCQMSVMEVTLRESFHEYV